MHVYSTIRHETQNLFWSNPDAWYCVSGEWLFAGGFAGHTHDSVEFLAKVEQVELLFDSMQSFACDWVDGQRVRASESRSWTLDERANQIWQLLQAKCPRLKRVLVSESDPQRHVDPWPDSLATLIDKCPATISISGVSYHRRTIAGGLAYQRCLWLRTGPPNSTDSNWALSNPNWTRESILLPPKKFRGPVGAFERTLYKANRIYCYGLSLRQLSIEAMERHNFEGNQRGFTCPNPACEMHFDQPGQWPLHAIETGHSVNATFTSELATQSMLQLERLMYMQKKDVEIAREKMITDWGVKGSEQRRIAEHAFLSQVEFDPLYAHSKPGKQASIWIRYGDTMNQEY